MSQDQRRLGAYAPPPDDYDTFDARDMDQDRRGWLFLLATAAVFVLFVIVAINTYQLGSRERGESPLITADAEPFRIAPEDPGGYETPDQDLTVHELRSSAQELDPGPPPLETAEVREEPLMDDLPQTGTPAAQSGDMPALRIETANADDFSAPDTGGEANSSGAGSNDDALDAAIADVLQDRDPVVQEPAQPAVTPTPPPSAASIPAAIDGQFLVQIMAARSEADAMSAWRDFARTTPDLAMGYAPDIQRADLGDRGIFYRLRIAAFATRGDAVAYCRELESRGQSCLVARR